jgi:hypothetical protein
MIAERSGRELLSSEFVRGGEISRGAHKQAMLIGQLGAKS